MNDDPNDLMSFVFMDARGKNPAVVRKVHPQFDPASVAFRLALPDQPTDVPADGRTLVVWNYEYQTPKIDLMPFHYLLRGAKPLRGPMPANHEYFSWHLSETARANPRQPIQIPTAAPFLADALLGINKPERIEILEMIREVGLLDQCLVSMHRTLDLHSSPKAYVSPQLAEYDDPRVTKTKTTPEDWLSMTPVVADSGNFVPASQVIPRRVYEASLLSIITETHPQIDQFFITEKTGKAFAAGRIFLLQGGPGYLRHLRELGFKTFAPYVNETYDTVSSITARNAAIVAELKRLSTEDLPALYRALLPVLEHNQQLMYSGELNKPAQRFLRDIQARHG